MGSALQRMSIAAGMLLSVTFVAAQAPTGQAPEGRGRGRVTRPVVEEIIPGYRFTLTKGSRASYRVREQMLGVNFPSDAVGLTDSITGTLLLNMDGSIDTAASKFTVNMATITSDQSHRDEFVNERTLDVKKYPTVVFVPRRIVGLPAPLPFKGQHGVEVIGDMTLHGVTKELTFRAAVSYDGTEAGGRLVTNFNFATFGLQIPRVARVLSVEDNIVLEIDVRMVRGK